MRACSACSGDYEDPDRTAAMDPGDEWVASDLATDAEDEYGGEADRRPISARQTVKNTNPPVD